MPTTKTACVHDRLRARPSLVFVLALLFTLLAPLAAPTTAHAAPALIVPTEAGRPWRIIQGYGCGTHNAWDRYSLDFASADGATYGAPVRAAASGEIWVYSAGSGTLILDHGGGFFTMYTHMASVVTTRIGTTFAQGEILGTVGDRGSPGVPHLHFTMFTAAGYRQSTWQSQPLSFVEGYDLPEIGGCNQHGGKVLIGATLADPQIIVETALVAGQWYTQDGRVEFDLIGATGLSQAWNSEPQGEPMFPGAREGYADLATAGSEGWHTLHLVAHAADGRRITTTVGPFGFDQQPPSFETLLVSTQTISSTGGSVAWPAAVDRGSGVAGYRIYIGPDPLGTSEWFVEQPLTPVPALPPGSHVVRAKPIDHLGNVGEWATVAQLIVP